MQAAHCCFGLPCLLIRFHTPGQSLPFSSFLTFTNVSQGKTKENNTTKRYPGSDLFHNVFSTHFVTILWRRTNSYDSSIFVQPFGEFPGTFGWSREDEGLKCFSLKVFRGYSFTYGRR